MTARLRIECSTTELLWHDSSHEHGVVNPNFSALARTRTAMPFSTSTSSLRVYQFHHEGGPKR